MIFDRPNSVELLKAVIDFLEEKIKDHLPKHLAFNLQIAINILKIVEREISEGETLNQQSMKILESLLGNSGKASIRQLAEDISSRKIDLDNKDLQKVLIEITKHKISIDNPNYSTFKKIK